MSDTTKWGRKLVTVASSVTIAVGSTIAMGTSAHATAVDGTIRIVATTPSNDTAVNGYDNQVAMDGFIAPPNGWYPEGSRYKQTYADTGSTFTVTYEAKDSNDALLTNTAIIVAVNKSYSGSTAALVCNGTTINHAGNGSDGGTVTLTTGNDGRATLTCVNSDTATTAGVIARPSSLIASAEIHSLHTQIWPTIAGGDYAADMQDFEFIPPAGVVIPPRTATATDLTFESDATSGTLPYDNFGGTLTATVDTAPAGGNGGKALKVHYNQGAPYYAGMFLVNYASGSAKVTDATHATVTANIYSASAGALNIRMKLEKDGLVNVPVADVTVQHGWNHVTFNFATDPNWSGTEEYTKTSWFFGFIDGNIDGKAAAADFYLDDVAFNGGVTPALPVAAVKPANTIAASLSGTAKVGKTLTAAKGTWSGTTPVTFSYKWYRCTKAATATPKAAPVTADKCTLIAGTTSSHKLVAADKGKYLRVLVTGTNSAGNAKSLSKTTAKIG